MSAAGKEETTICAGSGMPRSISSRSVSKSIHVPIEWPTIAYGTPFCSSGASTGKSASAYGRSDVDRASFRRASRPGSSGQSSSPPAAAQCLTNGLSCDCRIPRPV